MSARQTDEIRGPAALTFLRLSLVLLAVGTTFILLSVASIFLFSYDLRQKLDGFFVTSGLICYGLFAVCIYVGEAQKRKEHRAGYATIRSGPRELQLIDPKSKRVIKEAGAEGLSRRDYRLRVREARRGLKLSDGRPAFSEQAERDG